MTSLLIPLQDEIGFGFCVMDLRGIDANVEPLLRLFSEHLERSFQAVNPETNLQHRFEQITESLNETIASTHVNENWDFSANEVQAIVGLAANDQLFLTGLGDLTAAYLHREPDQRYKIYNLFRGIQTEQHRPDWSKLFTVVLDGDLHQGDVFLIGNREIPQQIEAEDLNQILVTLPPKSACEKMRQYFPIPSDLTLTVLRAESAHDADAMLISGAGSSLDHLSQTEEATSRMLEHQRPRKEDWPKLIKRGGKMTWALTLSSVYVALAILMGLIKSALQLVKGDGTSDRKVAWRSLRTRTGSSVKSIVTIIARGRGQRSGRQRLMTFAGTLLIVAVIMTTLVVRKNNQREEIAYQSLVQQIENLYDNASASIIYKNEDEARQMLLQGIDLISSLPTKQKDRQERATTLQESFNLSLAGLRHTTTIDALQLLASLPEGRKAATIGFDNETLYAFTTDGFVERYSASSSSFETKPVRAPEGFGTVIRSRYDDLNDEIYLFDGHQIARFDPDADTYEIVTVEGIASDITDFDIYARRIYSLSPSNEQIYRHEKTSTGFGAPSGWLQARTIPLSDAKDLSVDGSVWVFKTNGVIERYQRGFEESWSMPTIDPPLSTSITLVTSDQTTSLYLIDQENQRVIQIEKTSGTLTNQFTHEAFLHTRGILERDGKLFILTETGLYQFSL